MQIPKMFFGQSVSQSVSQSVNHVVEGKAKSLTTTVHFESPLTR